MKLSFWWKAAVFVCAVIVALVVSSLVTYYHRAHQCDDLGGFILRNGVCVSKEVQIELPD